MRIISSLLFLGLLLSPVLSGCSDGRPRRVPVSGRVLIDGEPLSYGTVMLVPQDARPSTAPLDAQGRFMMNCFEEGDGAVLGTHRVGVSAVKPLSGSSQKWLAPKRYVDYNNSGLEVEITGPTDDLKIELTWDGGRPFVETFRDEGY